MLPPTSFFLLVKKPPLGLTFSFNTDQGNISFSGYQYHSWNQTYGPVKKGFRASVSVGSSLVTVEIYVSKNNGPFALKASKSGDNSYTIDFRGKLRLKSWAKKACIDVAIV